MFYFIFKCVSELDNMVDLVLLLLKLGKKIISMKSMSVTLKRGDVLMFCFLTLISVFCYYKSKF